MDSLVAALLTGTVIGAAVTVAGNLLKPLVDQLVVVINRRWAQKKERRVVVEGVVERLRALRLDHQRAGTEGRYVDYELVLEAADAALLIHDRDFAAYLSRDIENTSGFYVLNEWLEQTEGLPGSLDLRGETRAAQWTHLKTLVTRASEFALSEKWDKAWAKEAEDLERRIEFAATVVEA